MQGKAVAERRGQLKFRGDEAVVWIDRVVLSPGQVGLVASLVQGQLDLSLLLGCLGCPRGDRIHGGLYAKRFDRSSTVPSRKKLKGRDNPRVDGGVALHVLD